MADSGFLTDLAGADQQQTAQPSDFLNDLATTAPAAPAASTAQQQGPPDYSLKGWGNFLGREGARVGATAVAGLPLMAMNLGVAGRNALGNAVNKMTGQPATPDYELPSTTFNRILDSYLPAPQSMLGKATEFMGTAALGGKLPMPEVGNAAPTAFQGATQGAESALTPAQQQVLASGRALGMRAQPGQEMGSKVMQQIDAKLESQPWTSGPYHAIDTQNSRVLSGAAARSIGENSKFVDSTVLDRANDRLGTIFENSGDPSRILMMDPRVTAEKVAGIDSELEGLLPEGTTLSGHPLVRQLLTQTEDGAINGQQLRQLSSKLGKAAYKQMSSVSGDRDMGQGLYQVKDHVDDLLQSTLGGAEGQQLATARQQYRMLMMLTKPGVVNPSTGDVSGRTLANVLQREDKTGYLLGGNQSDLYNAVRFSQAFKPLVGNSGTATRSGAGLLPLLGGVLGAGGGHPAGHGAVEGAGLGAIAGPAIGNLASRAYVRGAVPAAKAAQKVPGLLAPAQKPLLMGGLLSAQ